MITQKQYNEAADRIRTSRERKGDAAICDAWDAQERGRQAQGRVVRGWYDLPIAAQMWGADGRDVER